jgi:tetratricopeptide (TPR) repeat protein
VDALRCYQKSLALKRMLGDSQGEALDYETMAQDYEYAGNFEQAMENYKIVLDIYQQLGLKSEIQRVQTILDELQDQVENVNELNEDEMYSIKARDFL